MRLNLILVVLTAMMCMLLAGCSSSAQVSQAAPEEGELTSKILDLRNCDTTEELHTTLGSKAPVSYQITVARLATSTTTGESSVIPDEISAALEADIASAYQPAYEQAVKSAEQVELVVPGTRIRLYEIYWKQQVYRSTVTFKMNDQDFTAGYTYVLVVPELGPFTEMACTG
jgi:hypothetical protein